MSNKLFLIIAIAGSLVAFGGGFGGVHMYLTKEFESAVAAYQCSKNLAALDKATQDYAIAGGHPPGSTLGMGNLDPYLPNGRPACPSEGKYTIKETGTLAICSEGENGHTHEAENHLLTKYPARAKEFL